MKTTKIDAQEANALKAIYMAKRNDLNITYMDLESVLGVSYGAVGHFMTGRLRFDLDKGLRMCKLLNCKLEDFSPRLAGELLELSALAELQGDKQSNVMPTAPVIKIEDATERHPKALNTINKPTSDFIGFFVIVEDEMMADMGPRSIPVGSVIAVSTQHTKLEEGNIYLTSSPNWEIPIIREAKSIAGRWKLISKNEKLGLESEWFDEKVYTVIGQIKHVTVSM